MSSSSAILWRGSSRLTGEPIMVAISGLDGGSQNPKTGAMAQVWILRSDMSPLDAVKSGADAALCGAGKDACPYRPILGGEVRCYVNVGQAPQAVWKAHGRYPSMSAREAGRILAARGMAVRLGAYGDPAAVPVAVWRDLLAAGARHTGYTHQWRRFPALRAFLMASADSPEDAAEARRRGWRAFRVRSAAEQPLASEAVCPASDEGGHRTQCVSCRLCNGAQPGDPRRSIVIIDHGPTARRRKVAA